jgi:hypothetical protein
MTQVIRFFIQINPLELAQKGICCIKTEAPLQAFHLQGPPRRVDRDVGVKRLNPSCFASPRRRRGGMSERSDEIPERVLSTGARSAKSRRERELSSEYVAPSAMSYPELGDDLSERELSSEYVAPSYVVGFIV